MIYYVDSELTDPAQISSDWDHTNPPHHHHHDAPFNRFTSELLNVTTCWIHTTEPVHCNFDLIHILNMMAGEG